jgi:metal-responsive CopG/Arc/MetJ family transcriptional regulator
MVLCNLHNSPMQQKPRSWQRISVSLQKEQVETLRRIAAVEDRSVSYMVGQAIRMLLAARYASFLPAVHEKVVHTAEENEKSEGDVA